MQIRTRKGSLAASIKMPRRQFLAASAASLASLSAPGIVRAQDATIRIGYITSLTGPRAEFSEPATWNVEKFREKYANGIDIGGKNYKVEILVRDTQSNPARAGQVVSDLILREQVDILLADDADSHITGGELADQIGVPFVSTLTQWEPFIAARGSTPDKGYPFTFFFGFSAGDLAKNYVGQWNATQARKVVGDLYIDNPPGHAFADTDNGLAGAIIKAGYERIPGGLYRLDTDDFSNQIAKFKAANADIMTGFVFAPSFVTLWNQAAQMGYSPEIVTVAAAFLFPSGVEALGERGNGMSTEVWWSPGVPFSSSQTGQSAAELAAQWSADTGRQWTQPIGYMHALFEVGFNALAASGNPKEPVAVRDAINALQFSSILGPIDFVTSPVKSCAITDMAMGQWIRTPDGPFAFDLLITSNPTAPAIKPQADFKLLSELKA